MTLEEKIKFLESQNVNLNDQLFDYESDIRTIITQFKGLFQQLGLNDAFFKKMESVPPALQKTMMLTEISKHIFSIDTDSIDIDKVLKMATKYNHLIN